jgi:hypothetical protein
VRGGSGFKGVYFGVGEAERTVAWKVGGKERTQTREVERELGLMKQKWKGMRRSGLGVCGLAKTSGCKYLGHCRLRRVAPAFGLQLSDKP